MCYAKNILWSYQTVADWIRYWETVEHSRTHSHDAQCVRLIAKWIWIWLVRYFVIIFCVKRLKDTFVYLIQEIHDLQGYS